MKGFLVLLVLGLLSTVSALDPGNWSGITSPWSITGLYSTQTVYTPAYPLARYKAVTMVVLADDTSAAKFANDSLKFGWGYQIGNLVYDATGALDTAWGPKYPVDTMRTDSLGKVGYGSTSTALVETIVRARTDTSSVTGYACQMRQIQPTDRGQFIRGYLIGVTLNKVAQNKIAGKVYFLDEVATPTVAR